MAFENDGFPRATGRVLGWLTVCNPPHQTAREIAEAIGVSLGAVRHRKETTQSLLLLRGRSAGADGVVPVAVELVAT